MFEKIGRAAEQAATGLSRRGFLGWAGQGALAVAGALAFGSVAGAAPKPKTCCQGGGVFRCPPDYRCVGQGADCYCRFFGR